MTENEAKEFIKNFPDWNLDDQWLEEDEMQELTDTLISVLDEIQQYRNLGTVEELKELKENNFLHGSSYQKHTK